MSEILTHELTIPAPARIVYELLTDSDGFAEWMAVEAHAIGWGHDLGRLAARAEGGHPGPDPWADQRMPGFC